MSIDLITTKIVLEKSGDIKVITEYHEPEKLIEQMNELDPEHPSVHVWAAVLRYCLTMLDEMNTGIQKLIRSV